MATERAEFELHLDDRPFQQSMNRARGATVGLTESVNKAGASIGAAATSVSGLNTALGGSVGATNNLIGAAGNLATTFAAAGPVGLAIAAATTGVGLLIDAWQDAQTEARKTADETRAAAERMVKDLAALDLQLRARAAGVSTNLAEAVDRQNELAAKAEEFAKKLDLYGFGGNKATLPSTFTATDPLSLKLKGYSDEFVRLTKEAKTAEEIVTRIIALEEVTSTGGLGGGGSKPRAGRGGRRAGAADGGLVGPEMPFYVAQARAGGPSDDGTGLLLQLAFEEADAREKLSVRMADVEIKQQERVTDAYEQEMMARAAMAQQFAGTFFSLSEQIAGVLVDGQRDAATQILNIVAQTAGGFLIGKGIELVGAGVASALMPGGQALGAAQIAGGIALGSAGVALKVGGAAALESGASFAVGSTGAPTTTTSAGVGGPSRNSGGGGDGGGLTIVVNNGIGMSSEDTQRAVVAAYREGQRRGFR